MAKKQSVEIICGIRMESRQMNDGKIKNTTILFFENGLQYAKTDFGLDSKFEDFRVGDRVLITTGGKTIVQVQKA